MLTNSWGPGAHLTGAYVGNATITGMSLIGADLAGADFTNTDLATARTDATTTCPDTRPGPCVARPETDPTLDRPSPWIINGCHIEPRTECRGANLTRANLTNAELTGAELIVANLARTNLARANLAGADLTNTNLEGAMWWDGRRCGPGSIGQCA